MRMEGLCLIMLSICVSIVLGSPPPALKNLLVHSPQSLTLKPGVNATFTCNISALNYNPEDINWYRNTAQNTSIKIADLKCSENSRMYISTDWTLREAKLLIVNVTFNDSGKYFCTHVNVSESGQIITSDMSELFVNSFPSTVTDKTKLKDLPESNPDSQKISIISTSIILALLLLLAIGSTLIFMWYKQRNNNSQPQQQDLEKLPQDPSVYTVNYGILDFGASQPCRKSPNLSVLEQVEYATIMFPQQTPSMAEKRGRSAQAGK
ncbi:programmed cell death protein 1 [Rhinoderma darwinii]|uniref:programmed cell death protein 1 n=1 Tax=Rhinoderma darwinii TaxID=43563 RepID=UPI003F6817A1